MPKAQNFRHYNYYDPMFSALYGPYANPYAEVQQPGQNSGFGVSPGTAYDIYSNASGQGGGSWFSNLFGGGEGGAGAGAGAEGFGGMSNMMGAATPLGYAYLIAQGKLLENDRLKENPDDPMGNFGLAMLAPSGAQIVKDPKGMGLPTLLGAPFLTPFTASDEAKQTEPEWAGLMGK